MKLVTNVLHCGDARYMKLIPKESVQLVVTSPPYNVSKNYGSLAPDSRPLREYLAFLARVWKECLRVLVPGGRIVINIANTGRKPYLSLDAYITIQLETLGFLMRGKIVWDKGASAGKSTAWGTYPRTRESASASNPVLRDVSEYILIACKSSYRLERTNSLISGIDPADFIQWTKNVWKFNTVKVKGHPCPFPLDIPQRSVLMFTHEQDVVLDPFIGSGQTAIAALENNRQYIGYDIETANVRLAEERIADWQRKQGLKESL